jgi:hypothetical protein
VDEKSFVSWFKIVESIKAEGDVQIGTWTRPPDVAEKSGLEQWKRFVEHVSGQFNTIDDAPEQRFMISPHGDQAPLNLYPQDKHKNFLRSILIGGQNQEVNLTDFAAAELQIQDVRAQFSLKNLMLGTLRIH